jgi:hypothetical protein
MLMSGVERGVVRRMQVLVEDMDGGAVVEERVRNAAAGRVVRPIVLHGVGSTTLAAALHGIERSGVPCIVEEASGQAAELATHLGDATKALAEAGEWTIAILVGERNQHRWLHSDHDARPAPVVLERVDGGHKLVYFGTC